MFRLDGITDEAYQQHIIPWQNENMVFNLRYVSTVQSWFVDIEYKNEKCGAELATLGALMFESSSFPFRVQVVDKLGSGLDPFEKNDFIDRIEIRFMDLDDAEKVRGY